MAIKILFFGSCREALGLSETAVSLESATTVAQIYAHLSAKFPLLENFGNSLLFAVNEEHARFQDEVQPGDTLAIFPPVSGG